MNNLEQNIFKALAGTISRSDFENVLYQPIYIEKIASDDFIASLIDINYNNRHWRIELNKSALDFYGHKKYLVQLLKFYCLYIVESNNIKAILDIIYQIYRLHMVYEYKYLTLMQFYRFEDYFDLISCGYGHCSEVELVSEIKSYCKLYLEAYGSNTDYDGLLNLNVVSTSSSVQEKKVNNSSSEKEIPKIKKWFHFWK